jgi:hypothetical protein
MMPIRPDTEAQHWLNSTSVADPDPNQDPSDPHVFGPPGSGSGSISQRYGTMDPDSDPVLDPDPSIIEQL